MHIIVETPEGYLPDQYGKYATGEDMRNGFPVTSFPFQVTDIPADTVALALTLTDYDAVPVSGFTWIHWIAADIPVTLANMPANASRQLAGQFVQGRNSNAGSYVRNTDPEIYQRYTGPTPPNADHDYTFTVYALNTTLDLPEGFWLNELRHALPGHVLEEASIDITSRV
ncbi:YbhB/YbcL family Raf kinase inhibitor-like protein [Lacticaseibacillus pantheris]|jgi:Raf kinase inhibitor-like YbhB/YbcL family protein|uniref:YbhB/YbcL family Raf kinase inhibitor-like protein n=1 Tax=Lacticaseibacillus pantheris TaxID=171523 RepID=UPI0006D15D47|nr:YbhB/YbcL family Raf kinase inhibitor-like protein [Lacticaseibacillus pantheris]